MNTLSLKIVLCTGLMMLFGQHTAFADYRSYSHRDSVGNHWRVEPAPHNFPFDHNFDRRRQAPPPSFRPYYQFGYRVNPLPYGHNRIFFNNVEHSFYDRYFYRRHPRGYIVVPAPGFSHRH